MNKFDQQRRKKWNLKLPLAVFTIKNQMEQIFEIRIVSKGKLYNSNVNKSKIDPIVLWISESMFTKVWKSIQ